MWYLNVELELLSVTSIEIKAQCWVFSPTSMKILSKAINIGFIPETFVPPITVFHGTWCQIKSIRKQCVWFYLLIHLVALNKHPVIMFPLKLTSRPVLQLLQVS